MLFSVFFLANFYCHIFKGNSVSGENRPRDRTKSGQVNNDNYENLIFYEKKNDNSNGHTHEIISVYY